MSANLVYEGEQRALDLLISTITAANIKIGLYTAIGGSGKNRGYADVTDCTFSGYTAGGTATSWAAGAIDANDKWARVGATVTFTHNGGGTSNTVLGYYVYDSSVNKLLFFEAFSAPISMSASGNAIPVTPTLYSGDLTTPF